MKHYRIECTDDSDQLMTTHDYECADDLAALERATALCKDFGVIVWDGDRRVVWLRKGGEGRLEVTKAKEDEIRNAMAPPNSKSVRDKTVADIRKANRKKSNCGATP